ncbi:hypothetical protein [Natronorubrum thiooxidans]|uniref:Uncharacterized protein n=1 Tax=Natronorubrum thiooxidans TaxID=308853 RepID=A0A1N7FJG8_9EURY|nr:hypothetical protein [Natronorubrum thiooxidans]SIS00441.1 hypothetical protein SAMN05421752_10738 [Natronorubrum thiooxidans]
MGVQTRLHREVISAFSTGPTDDRSSDGRLGRYLLVAVGALVVAYVVTRVLGSSDDAVDEIRERATDAVPDDPTQAATETLDRADEVATIPIGDSESDEPEPDAESAIDSDDDVIDDAETNAEYTDDERSADEIAERAESNVQEEPAEPGEMTVDEDVAEELVDEVDTDSASETETESDSADDEE